MTQITIDINDSLLSKAIIESQAKQISLSEFINNSLEVALTKSNSIAKRSINITDILQKTIECVKELETGKRFFLVEVCKSEDWEALNSGERKQFGKVFRRAIEDAVIPLAKHVDRTKSNLAIYQRT